MLLGTNPAESKKNFIAWLDNVILSRTSVDPRMVDYRRQYIPGKYSGIRNDEFLKILKALTSLGDWTGQCIQNRLSCGTLFITTTGGRGGTTEDCIWIGPFQKT